MPFVRDNYILIGITFLISLAITFYAVTVDPIINLDALIYLSAADEIKHGNFVNAFELYKWPFFSAAIASVNSIFGVSAQTSAFIFNGLMHALAMVGFLACVHALGGNKRTLVIAAILILLFPSFNKYRAFIIRDAGFLAFYLWSIYHLFMAIQTDHIKRYLYAFLLMLMAMIFRIEAVAMLAIVPAYLLYSNSQQKHVRIFWLIVTIVGSGLLFFGISIWLFGEQSKTHGGGIFSMLQSSMEHLQNSWEYKLKIIREQLLNEFSFKVAPAILIIAVACIAVSETLRRLAYVFAFFSWHALKNQLVLNNHKQKQLFYVLCLIQVILLFLFALINMFLVSRHTMALTLTILILAPFSIEYFIQRWQNRRISPIGYLKVSIPIFATLLTLLALDGLDLKTNKIEVIDAGKWVSENTRPNSSIYSNRPLLLHYAGERPAHFNLKFTWKELDHLLFTKRIFDFDYAVIMIDNNFEATEKYLTEKLLEEPSFEKKFGDDHMVFIYDIKELDSEEEFDQRYLKIPQSQFKKSD